ncbi:MAG: bifunctional glutamate N-acetyltransferase/amino-acid acetyltransferase ArgJ [Gammaproteobacteria bacterium]|jgi:glutamate N-acetyltransferase/amino-acid N-acetyltransferase
MSELTKQIIEQECSALQAVAGVRVGTAAAGIKYQGRDDLLLMEITEDAEVAAVFTRNAFCAAPVVVAREHIAKSTPRYLLINAGNANAGTGQQGIDDSERCCDAVSELMQCQSEAVLPFSTGVIGEYLPVDRMVENLPQAIGQLEENVWPSAANAIMTTDTVPKGVSRSAVIDGHKVTVSGIAKGAGMVCPNMATLLSFVACDAALSNGLLQQLLKQAVEKTFNRITVDGDTSTNDACVLIATGQSGLPLIHSSDHPAYAQLLQLVTDVLEFLARAIIRDAEGATKLVNVTVKQGKEVSECETVAYTIAHSPLVKTALFASDPNWGRILAAVGRAGIADFEIDKVNIELNGVRIVTAGGRDNGYTEEQGKQAMAQDEIAIEVDLGRGDAEANIWTCDLSYDYVKINAEYRT